MDMSKNEKAQKLHSEMKLVWGLLLLFGAGPDIVGPGIFPLCPLSVPGPG